MKTLLLFVASVTTLTLWTLADAADLKANVCAAWHRFLSRGAAQHAMYR